jgi:hypothetical protein
MYSYEEYPEPPYVIEYKRGFLYYVSRTIPLVIYEFISYEKYPGVVKEYLYDISEWGHIRNTKRKIEEIEKDEFFVEWLSKKEIESIKNMN